MYLMILALTVVMQVSRNSAAEVFVSSLLMNKKHFDVSFGVSFCCFIIFNLLFMCKINNLLPLLDYPSGTRNKLHISHSTESHTDTLTFSAKQRGGALQEFSDLLQRSFLSAADAALGVLATRWGGDLITDDSEPQLVSQDVRTYSTSILKHITAEDGCPDWTKYLKHWSWSGTEVAGDSFQDVIMSIILVSWSAEKRGNLHPRHAVDLMQTRWAAMLFAQQLQWRLGLKKGVNYIFKCIKWGSECFQRPRLGHTSCMETFLSRLSCQV